MSNKQIDDILQEGIHGKKEIKPAERKRFLGTLRERVVIVLTKGQLMQDNALNQLANAMRQHPDTKLLLNGEVSSRFMKEEKALANQYNIPYTVVMNQDAQSDLGAVLTYDHAVDIEEIFVEEETREVQKEDKKANFITRIKNWFQ
ncbi:YueI family protein [Pontibacillus litoralis]|uniref:DUF1694 domain-containing protein n=1 Tax=Pontibacillus litoralis JSM 072002 TaxID=1385512 RepID=A0A0A5HUM7_9BACI|nr:YueI family protein [Pontibacillus litoralis]KGX87342.1 hypothetical protein N784_15650 [Pontibacillus litoralis JSM 072002]